ncbi:WG repeat-containing protein [Niabella hirudinis]|uniref:WG repeat-containing protein n=1 Tax=Niabella hirudinis TaxID=1285929 RepID=UPI003EB70C16
MKPLILTFVVVLFSLFVSYAQNLKMVQDSAGNCGYKNRAGDLVIPYKYRLGHEFSEGLAAVYEDGKFGFMDENEKLVIPIEYTVTFDFSHGLAAVKLNGKWGYIDKKGKEIVPCEYDFTYGFYEEMAAVQRGNKWGFVDKSGKLVIPCIYASVYSSFSEGLVAVKLNDKWGYIDKAGNTVIPFSYDDAGSFYEGLAAVQPVRDKGYGYINKKGAMAIPVQFKKAYSFDDNGIAMVEGETASTVHIDKTGKVIDVNYQTTGKGKFRFRTGEVYDGEIVYGERTGKGNNVWANGDVYVGDWKDNKMTGKGKKVLENGNSYDGDWKDGMFNGKGKYMWADGAVYEGDWVNGNMTGKGKYKWANGNVYNGDWKDNNLNGKGILTKTNGAVQNGDWVNGVFSGVTKQTTDAAAKMSTAEAAAYKALEYRDAGNYTAALPEAQKALKLDAHNFLALFARGLLYAEYDKNNAKAIDFYTKAIAANAKDYRPFLFRAYAFTDNNRLADAKNDLDKAIAIYPKCFNCFMLRAHVFGKEQKWAAARDEAQLALNLKPGSEKAKSSYEMYKNFADPETIDATPYAKKEEHQTVTYNRGASNTYTQSQSINLSNIKYIGGDDEDDYEENPAYARKRNKRYLSQSDMNNIIQSNSPSPSSNESGWDKWFRERDRQSERDYKQKNGQYRGY